MNPEGVTDTRRVLWVTLLGFRIDGNPFPRVRTKRATLGNAGKPRWGSGPGGEKNFGKSGLLGLECANRHM